jgi:hypothetical protein
MRGFLFNRQEGVSLALLSIMVFSMFFSGGTVRAQGGGPTSSLLPGEWTASATAAGAAGGSPGGMNYVWNGEVNAFFLISVPAEGVANGTWSHNGTSDVLITGSLGGESVTVDAEYDFFGSGGTVTGTPAELILLGENQNIGTMEMTTSAGTRTAPISSTNALPQMTVDIIHANCDEAFGTWAWTIEQVFEGVRLSADLVGVFWGARVAPGLQEQIQELNPPVSQAEEIPEDFQGPLHTRINLYLAETEVLLATFPAWNMDEVMEALTEAERLLNELRNLSPCEERQLGEGAAAQYSSALTFLVQQLIGRIGEAEKLSGKNLLQILEVSARVGATGPGAPNPEAAASAEAALHQAAEGILEANVDGEGGKLKANQDTIQVMLAGLIKGWTYSVDGREVNPAEALPELQVRQAQQGGDS